jgi:hypothetical protein
MIQYPRLAFGNFILLFYGKFGLLVTPVDTWQSRSIDSIEDSTWQLWCQDLPWRSRVQLLVLERN